MTTLHNAKIFAEKVEVNFRGILIIQTCLKFQGF